ncbi:hypothetical protein [Lacibacter sp.]|uniref:hypothetical protein n=1 Tax=Lacibacter sp. TaxID=1915409 RepID=UPI002B4B327B|nr:hypothetical protein [Lacibacter sp.]HLP37319.1 hypothetical protein [Lacibacter sp.]
MFRTLTLVFTLTVACNQDDKSKKINPVSVSYTKSKKENKKPYKTIVLTAREFKQQHITSDSFELLYSRFIVDSIIPYWYGTKWNFYGTTEVPQTGSIACGYFVTTVLRDARLHINRIKLAQAASEEMMKIVCHKKSIKRFRHTPIQDFVKNLRQLENGLYIVGLDFHTGFIYHENEQLHFIHASYQTPQIVIQQNVHESTILAASKYKVVGKVNLLK